LVYREYEIGTEYSVGDTVFLDKEKLLQEIQNPTMFVVFYNDEILREIPFDDVSSEMVLERTGYYGFYVRDEEGTLQNVGKFCVNAVLGCVIKDAEKDLSAWKDMIEKN